MSLHSTLRSKFLPWTLAWVLTIVLGVVAGRHSVRRPSEQERIAALVEANGGRPLASQRSSESRSTGPATAERGRRSPPTDGEARERLEMALLEADQLSRTRELLRLVDTLAPDQFPALVEAFRSQGLAQARRSDYNLLIHAWVDADPYAAVAYLEESEPSGEARRAALTAWAAADPFAATAWVEGREDVGGTNDWTVGLLRGLASTDPELARQRLEDLPPGKTRSTSMEAILPYVVQQGFDFTSDWIAGITGEDLQRGTARRAARSLTRLNPEQAGDWIGTMANRDSRRAASEEVSDQWARQDLEAARRWTENLPEDTRTEAAEGIARQMARQDPERTAEWLDSLGDNPDLDGARRIFLAETADQAPELALDNVYTLSQQDEQVRMYHRILSRWSREDQDAARMWVLANPSHVPESVQRRYLGKNR